MTNPTMKEIAGWLREACSYDICLCNTLDDQDVVRNKWADRSAQVEAMNKPNTCDTCKYWEYDDDTEDAQIGTIFDWCTCRESLVENLGPKFGCVHHELKPQPPVKK